MERKPLANDYEPVVKALYSSTLFVNHKIGNKRKVSIYPSIMRADLLSLYITIASVIGEVFKERIDPALTIGMFLLGFESRVAITKVFPSMVKTLVDYADYEYMLGVTPLDPTVPERSPL